MSWTDERVELLKRLWNQGLSASQIAGAIGDGVSRNAVIGKVHRLGLSGRPKDAPAVAPRPPRKEAPAQALLVRGGFTLAQPPMPAAAPAPKPAADVVIPMSDRVTLLELRESMCRWPFGDPCGPTSASAAAARVRAAPIAPTMPTSRISRRSTAGGSASASGKPCGPEAGRPPGSRFLGRLPCRARRPGQLRSDARAR